MKKTYFIYLSLFPLFFFTFSEKSNAQTKETVPTETLPTVKFYPPSSSSAKDATTTKDSSSTKEDPALAKPNSTWKNSWQTSLWLNTSFFNLQKTSLIADSKPFALPKNTSSFLIQENFSSQKENWLWAFRPSVEVKQETYTLYPLEGEKKRNRTEGRINELYFQKNVNPFWTWAFGLQNIKWGPGELLSPSNPLFHLDLHAHEPSYQAPGHALIRIHYNPFEKLKFLSLFEFSPNEETDFVYKASFVPKGLIKISYELDTPEEEIGFIIGNEQMHDPFMGQYGYLNLDENFSFYFDVKETWVSKRYYPHLDYGQAPRMNLYDYHDSIYLLALWGFRFQAEDYDFRWEEISNELGYSQTEIENIYLSMGETSPRAEENQKAFRQNGRELPSKNYTYLSLRLPSLRTETSSRFFLRALQSHRDDSGQASLYWEVSSGQHWTFFLGGQVPYGKKGSEMTLLHKGKAQASLRYRW